jgi:hypothetical protein
VLDSIGIDASGAIRPAPVHYRLLARAFGSFSRKQVSVVTLFEFLPSSWLQINKVVPLLIHLAATARRLTLHSLSLLMAAVLMESGWNAAEGQQVGNPLLVQGQHFLQILLGVPGVTSSIPDAQDDESASRDDAQVAGAKIV